MSTYETDPRISEFTTALSQRARHLVSDAAHAQLLKALQRGHEPAVMAKACSRDLPKPDGPARALILERLRWYADRAYEQPAPRPAGPRTWCGRCDDTSFRFEVDPQTGRPVRPCPRCHPSTQLGAAS